MKLEEKSKSYQTITDSKSNPTLKNDTNADISKPNKVLSKKNHLDDDEKLRKDANSQQTESSEENQTTSDSQDTSSSSSIKVAAADTAKIDTETEAGKSSSTGISGSSTGISNYAFAGLIGLGAIGIAAASSGGGGSRHSSPSGSSADTTSPMLASANRSSTAQTITLTFSENLDAAHLPANSALTISLNNNPTFSAIPIGSTFAIGPANQLVITLPAGTFKAGDTIAIRYTDPSAANDSNALQDTAGNDIASFTTTSFSVIDGYVRDAKIYIDTNGNGIAENNEFTGVTTDENGNFFLPANRPAGTIIATGGVNIDTGIANTIEFKAPTESSVLTPLTTLIQAYITANNVVAADAENAIKAALGIPDNIDLLNYDPLAGAAGDTTALAVQKIAASIATIITLAAGTDNSKENAVVLNLVSAIRDANNSNSMIDLTSSNTLSTIVSNTDSDVQTISIATTAINNASSFEDISAAQSNVLDHMSPAIPTLLQLSNNADSGVKDDGIADQAGGNDTLTSGDATFVKIEGGTGNDILDARLSSNADLFGGEGNDVLYGAQYSNEYIGGRGADKITGGSDPQNADFFLFKQGDSTSVSFTDQGNLGLGNGDTFVFNGGADVILSGLVPLANGESYGDGIGLYSGSYNYNDIDLKQMTNIPMNGLVTDQSYFFQQGSYAEATGIFTVSETGADALIVYDGDSSNGVSQTALVLANTNSAHLVSSAWGMIYLEPTPLG